MRKLLVLGFFVFGFAAAPAVADEVQYVIPAMGVSCGGTAAHAEKVVKSSVDVRSVKADHESGTVTAVFDEKSTNIAAVMQSLSEAGYEPGEPQRIQ